MFCDETHKLPLPITRANYSRPLAEVRDDIEKDLLIQEQARIQKKWIDRLKSKTFLRYY